MSNVSSMKEKVDAETMCFGATMIFQLLRKNRSGVILRNSIAEELTSKNRNSL